jgi:hypothetical protein
MVGLKLLGTFGALTICPDAGAAACGATTIGVPPALRAVSCTTALSPRAALKTTRCNRLFIVLSLRRRAKKKLKRAAGRDSAGGTQR